MAVIDKTREHFASTQGILRDPGTLEEVGDEGRMPDKPEATFHSEYSFDFSAKYGDPLLGGFRLLVDALYHVFGRQIRRSARHIIHADFALSIKTKKETWSRGGKSI